LLYPVEGTGHDDIRGDLQLGGVKRDSADVDAGHVSFKCHSDHPIMTVSGSAREAVEPMQELQPTGAQLIIVYKNANGSDRSAEVGKNILVECLYSQGTVSRAPEFVEL
jgi:hypothetical protein